MKIKNFAIDKLFPLLIIWLVNLIMVLSQANNTKYCHIRQFKNNLVDFPIDCVYVIGFLDIFLYEINNARAFQILNSIEYVTEYIRIYDSFQFPVVFSMTNLRAIYGRKLYDGRYSLIIDKVQKVAGIDFSRLVEISAGDVGFIENYGLCNAPYMILWKEIFAKPNTQTVNHAEADLDDYECTEEMKNVKNCHAYCDKLDGKSYCYGPKQIQCQLRTRCRETKGCDRCFDNIFYGKGCCSDLCAGGCVERSALSCHVCKGSKYDYYGKCLDRCPTTTFEMKPNLCVDSCPKSLMQFDGNDNKKLCVSSCPEGYANFQGTCTKCAIDQCPKTCKLIYPNGDHIERLNRTSLLSLRGCHHLIGSIIIDSQSFLNDKLITVDNFMSLSDLRRIEGILVINLDGFPSHLLKDAKFKSLFFLGNLREIDGIQTESVQQFTPGFFNTPFFYLGLKSLQLFNVTNLIISGNPKLKYAKTVEWKKLGVDHVKIDTNYFNPCHKYCNPRWGCWGPGEEQCVIVQRSV